MKKQTRKQDGLIRLEGLTAQERAIFKRLCEEQGLTMALVLRRVIGMILDDKTLLEDIMED